MKPQSFLPLLAAASITSAAIVARYPPDYCHADNCLRAIRGTPNTGRFYCSATLGLWPIEATTSTTELVTEGLTTVFTSTEVFTVTRTTYTSETTITPPPELRMVRRDEDFVDPTDPKYDKKVAYIEKMCQTNDHRIYSGCSCLLKTGQNATYTITEWFYETTTVPTVYGYDYTYTTTDVEATATYLPLIKNPGFDNPSEPLRYWTIAEHYCDSCTYTFGPNAGSSTSPNALKIIWRPPGYTGLISSSDIQVQAGKAYKYKFQFKIDGAPAAYPAQYMAHGWSREVSQFFSGVATNDWQTVESIPRVFTEGGAVKLELYVFVPVGLSEKTEETFWFDSFQIWEVPNPNL